MIQITVRGTNAVKNKFKQMATNYPNIIRATVRASALQVEKQAKANCPVKTGNLRRSIMSEESQKGNRYIARIGPDIKTAKYAEWVEKGHTQQPGRYVPAIGKRLVASWVEGKWYMARTAIMTQNQVINNLSKAFRKAVK